MDATELVEAPAAAPNPWLTMWAAPRRTTRQLIQSTDPPSWIPVIALAAVGAAMASVQLDPVTGEVSANRSAVPVIIGAAQVVAGILVGPYLVAIVGGWLGGEGDPADIRTGLAWSNLPTAASALLWVPLLLVSGARAFSAHAEASSPGDLVGIGILMVMAVLSIWTLVLSIGSLAEVHRFSIGRALLTLIILAVPLLLLGALR